MPDLRAYARGAATKAGCDPDLFERQIQQESGFDPDAYNQGSGATGIAQIVARFHPDVDPTDPIASLDYAAHWMARLHDQYGSYKMALAAYNWGPGNVSRWDGRRESLPDETERYLDVIMGPGWPEPTHGSNGTAHASDPTLDDNGRPATAGVLGFRVARVEPDRLNLRASPGRGAAVIERLAEGTVVEPLGPAQAVDDLTWLLTREPGGAEGWAAVSFLDAVVMPKPGGVSAPAPAQEPAEPEPEPRTDVGDPKIYRVNTDGVRLRGKPGTGPEAPILAMLDGGTLVKSRPRRKGKRDVDGGDSELADGYTWRRVQVNAPDGQRGWIAAPYLSPVETCSRSFDPRTPTELQLQSWTCSIRSTMWLLKSLGIRVTPAEAQDAMSPAYVSSDVGLLDASGAGIVEVLRDVWGVTAFNRSPASFDEVASWAGRYPVAIGGRNWCHWTAVRGFIHDPDAGSVLVLANPAGTGPRYGQQTLNRQQFADLGWFSAVVIPTE